MYTRNFPNIKFGTKKMPAYNSYDQLWRIKSEATEAIEEYVKGNKYDAGIEVLDIIHAAETYLFKEFTDEEIELLMVSVTRKNDEREYYGKVEQ